MKNYFNNSSESEILDHHLDGVFMAQISEFVIMNVLAVLISLLIVSTNSLVIYWIIKAQAKSARSDFGFIYLSVSNIGVGLFSVPIQCVTLYYFKYLQNRPLIMIILGSFSRYFPYTFSCIFTAVIAVDRVFVIILDRRYKDLVTLKILKIVAVILFLCSATNSSIITIHNTQSRRFSTRWVNGSSADYSMVPVAFFVLNILSTVVVILAHLYILYFASRRSGLKQLRKHHGSNGKRLTKTITGICISQLICVTPYIVFQLAANEIPDKLFFTTDNWLGLLVACQCFCNALTILHNKKPRKISKDREGTSLMTDTSRRKMRFQKTRINLRTLNFT